jgi:hypothetical protein
MKRNRLDHKEIFDLYAAWKSIPESIRKPRTEKHLSSLYGLSTRTFRQWKLRSDLWDSVEFYSKCWMIPNAGKILQDFVLKYTSIGKSLPLTFRTWLEYHTLFNASEWFLKGCLPELRKTRFPPLQLSKISLEELIRHLREIEKISEELEDFDKWIKEEFESSKYDFEGVIQDLK